MFITVKDKNNFNAIKTKIEKTAKYYTQFSVIKHNPSISPSEVIESYLKNLYE